MSVVRGEASGSGEGGATMGLGMKEGSVALQRTRSEGVGTEGMMVEYRGLAVVEEERLLISLQVRLWVRLQFVSFFVALHADTAMSEDKDR